MSIKEFIKSALEQIHTAFPLSRLEYQYKDISNTHFIKITPHRYFSADNFIDLDIELTDKFNAAGYDSSLCFLTVDSLVQIDQPETVITPRLYRFTLEVLAQSSDSRITLGSDRTQQPQSDFSVVFDGEESQYTVAA